MIPFIYSLESKCKMCMQFVCSLLTAIFACILVPFLQVTKARRNTNRITITRKKRRRKVKPTITKNGATKRAISKLKQ